MMVMQKMDKGSRARGDELFGENSLINDVTTTIKLMRYHFSVNLPLVEELFIYLF
jgi:hypothetical protein